MSKYQVWLSRSREMEQVIEEARRTFPDADTDGRALTRALFHWHHGRQENSKRGALADIQERLARIERRLGIEGNDHDTDHA